MKKKSKVTRYVLGEGYPLLTAHEASLVDRSGGSVELKGYHIILGNRTRDFKYKLILERRK